MTTCALLSIASSAFSTKIRPTTITMPTRHKALQSMIRDITNTDTIITRALTGHVSLVTVQEDGILSEYQWVQVTHMAMTQYEYKVAVRKFGDEARNAIIKELTQVHNCKAFALQYASLLTYGQRRRALKLIMHVKHKRDDSKKARLCADGRTH